MTTTVDDDDDNFRVLQHIERDMIFHSKHEI